MKRTTYLWMATALVALALGTQAKAQSDSLGDVARSARKESHPAATKKFDNDNLPKTDKLSVVGAAPDESATASLNTDGQPSDASQPDAGQAAASADSKTPPTVTAGESAEDRQKVYDEWKGQIADQKGKVELLAREFDVLQREYRLRAAAFYADAGNRLRNSGAWDKEDAQYKQQLDAKQKALDAAKKELDDLQEKARKSGVPSSVRQ